MSKSASRIRESSLTHEEIHKIISNSAILSIRDFLITVLKESRRTDISPVELFELQGKIAEKMIVFQKQISLLKKASDRKSQNREWLTREIYKAHLKMLREVVDGIAFRFLRFERAVLRQLSNHNQTGHLDEGFLQELEKAAFIVNESNFYVILNDLTHFLRYGDLTIVSPEGNLIDEVKTKGTAKGKQKENLKKLIKNLNEKVLTHQDTKAQYIKLPGRPVYLLKQVEEVINTAMKSDSGVFAKRISPYTWVSAIYIPQMTAYYKQNKKMPELPNCPFNNESTYSSFNNLMFFDQFSPNMVPYTIYPFKEEVICDIMLGQIQLKVVVDKNKLKKSFKGKGWKLEYASRDDILAVYDTDDINRIKAAINDPRYHDTLSKGNFVYKIPREVLLRTESEFCSAKSIVNSAEVLMSNTVPRKRMVAVDFEDEHLIWK